METAYSLSIYPSLSSQFIVLLISEDSCFGWNVYWTIEMSHNRRIFKRALRQATSELIPKLLYLLPSHKNYKLNQLKQSNLYYLKLEMSLMRYISFLYFISACNKIRRRFQFHFSFQWENEIFFQSRNLMLFHIKM